VEADDDESFLATLKSFEGRRATPVRVADDPVSQPVIRHWCHALGDGNPVYTDPEAAAASVHGEIVAPPTMLACWTHHDRRFQPTLTEEHNEERLLEVLAEAGFSAVLGVSCEQIYERYPRLGDRLTHDAVIESVSPRKQTKMGPGHFVTTKITFTNQHGEFIGASRLTVLRYRPAAGG
jgi:hypothetical protein